MTSIRLNEICFAGFPPSVSEEEIQNYVRKSSYDFISIRFCKRKSGTTAFAVYANHDDALKSLNFFITRKLFYNGSHIDAKYTINYPKERPRNSKQNDRKINNQTRKPNIEKSDKHIAESFNETLAWATKNGISLTGLKQELSSVSPNTCFTDIQLTMLNSVDTFMECVELKTENVLSETLNEMPYYEVPYRVINPAEVVKCIEIYNNLSQYPSPIKASKKSQIKLKKKLALAKEVSAKTAKAEIHTEVLRNAPGFGRGFSSIFPVPSSCPKQIPPSKPCAVISPIMNQVRSISVSDRTSANLKFNDDGDKLPPLGRGRGISYLKNANSLGFLNTN